MQIQIIRARPEDANLLHQIVMTSKGYWGYSDDWMMLWISGVKITPEYVCTNEVYAAEIEGEIVGFYALKKRDQSICELEHLWVIPKRIGMGVGRALFTHALQRASHLGAKYMEWAADRHAAGFYKHMGGKHIRDYPTRLEGAIPIFQIEVNSEKNAPDS
jgi:GNAT superfamily N-acetyltransferase